MLNSFSILSKQTQKKSNKKQRNQDVELLNQFLNTIPGAKLEKDSHPVLLIETLKSERNMTLVIHYIGINTLNLHQKNYNFKMNIQIDMKIASDIILIKIEEDMYELKNRIDIAAHISKIVKIRHHGITSSIPLYPSIQALLFIPPIQHHVDGAQRLLNSRASFNDEIYTNQ